MIAGGNHTTASRLWRAVARHSAPLKPTSLVTFLFGDKKVTPPSGTADENDFPFSIDRVLPDPCGGPSFLVSARKEAKKPTGEALNVALPRAKADELWYDCHRQSLGF